MFESLLIANRGEIACRIIRTARRLGVRTAAVFSEADAQALHVELADMAVAIGPAPPSESYLNIESIIDAARRAGADAIHPGYGFLSEDANFAQACIDAGFTFVGPPPSAMRAMGEKTAAKEVMRSAGVSVVPGFAIDKQTDVLQAAEKLGYPLLIKSSCGGGGRGMRVVESTDALPGDIARAAQEARDAFGDPRLLIEKYLPAAKHIEVQIFADRFGNIVAFPERDCSVQRRHQKIVEETPAPKLAPGLRRQLQEAAVTAARAVGYRNAGTVEFLVSGSSFYFLEMNARLQVEHPITEMICRQDLVEWQLRIAAGEAAPETQTQLSSRGHAVEARICAEDPTRSFLPAVGVISHLHVPPQRPDVRIDAGVREGDAITRHYDSLIAKLIAYGDDREEALRKLDAALAETRIVGVATNLGFLRKIISVRDFRCGDYNTRLIENNAEVFSVAHSPEDEDVAFAAAAVAWLADLRTSASATAISPWDLRDGWRIFGPAPYRLELRIGATARTLDFMATAGGARLKSDEREASVSWIWSDDVLQLTLDGMRKSVGVAQRVGGYTIVIDGLNYDVQRTDAATAVSATAAGDRMLRAPLPARVTALHVASGAWVEKDTPLVVLEAMKMEIVLSAPNAGIVETVACAVGDITQEGALLIALSAGDDE